jgi:hypothetical protein
MPAPQIRRVALDKLTPNDVNPRSIKDQKFQKLVANIQNNAWMLEYRPVVVDDNGVILGGNMRYRAAQHLGWTDIPTINAKDLTEEQRKAFVILDNQDFGEWDFDVLGNTYEPQQLIELGFEPAELGIKVAAPEFIAQPENEETDIGNEEDFAASHVKMVQLFCTQENYPEFINQIMRLQEIYHTDNVTDTVLKAVADAYNSVDKSDAA